MLKTLLTLGAMFGLGYGAFKIYKNKKQQSVNTSEAVPQA